MRAMLFRAAHRPLEESEQAIPVPADDQVLVEVRACGVCRTDLHLVDGELPNPKLPVVPGHEIVGEVVSRGAAVKHLPIGSRVGVPWLGWTCGRCGQCLEGRENLCERAAFTGFTLDGGYAEYALADARYCFPLSTPLSDAEAAPLLCAGLIGYRSLVMAGEAQRLGLYGFGAAAHIIAQFALHQGREVYAFTRPGDLEAQRFATELGASWAGDSDRPPPVPLDAAILYAPVGSLVPAALRAVRPAGTVVCAGIHMSDIPSFPYSILWGERCVRSVANLTRRDATDFFAAIAGVPIETSVTRYELGDANRALEDLRQGRLKGAAVLLPEHVRPDR